MSEPKHRANRTTKPFLAVALFMTMDLVASPAGALTDFFCNPAGLGNTCWTPDLGYQSPTNLDDYLNVSTFDWDNPSATTGLGALQQTHPADLIAPGTNDSLCGRFYSIFCWEILHFWLSPVKSLFLPTIS